MIESLRKLNYQSGHLFLFSSLSSWHLLFSTREKRIEARSCFFKHWLVIKYEEVQRSSAWLITVPFFNIRYRNNYSWSYKFHRERWYIIQCQVIKFKLWNLYLNLYKTFMRSDSKMPSLNQMGSQNGIFGHYLGNKTGYDTTLTCYTIYPHKW